MSSSNTNSYFSYNEYQSPLARQWVQEPMKSQLIESIVEERKNKQVFSTKVTDRQIIEEYFKLQMAVGADDKLRELVHQVGLEKADQEQIQQISADAKKSQLKWGVGMTAFSFMFYKLLLSKRKTFYNFFQKKHRYQWISHIKKGLSFFTLFVVQVNLLNFGFDKSIPNDILGVGLFRKYKIEYEKVYI